MWENGLKFGATWLQTLLDLLSHDVCPKSSTDNSKNLKNLKQ